MKKKQSLLKRILNHNRKDLLTAFFLTLIFISSIPILTYIYFANDLVSKDAIMNRNDTGVTLLDRNNEPFFTFYDAKNRVEVSLADVPDVVQKAAIASEDKDFYQHPGFSLKSIIRAFIANLSSREIEYGGSTITQQLVKNALLSPKRSFLRKYQEVILAQEIERRYTKNEILEMYFNSVYFGEGSFGIEEAAHSYFGQRAKDLDLAKASMLIGLLPSPSRYSPLSGDRNEAKKHQEIVLQKMEDQGYITHAQHLQAKAENIIYKPTSEDINKVAPHFALMVKDELVKQYGEEYISRSGFKVRTTLDVDWQIYAEKVVKEQVQRLAVNDVSNGAVVAIDPRTGEIKALVGSYDWYDNTFGKLNITTAKRQPGSSFKPLVYATAFEKHLITPATVMKDNPVTFQTTQGPYSPKDYDRKYRGDVLVRRALANSLNIPSVEIMAKVGVPTTLEMAKQFGLTTLEDESHYGLSLVLGTAEVKLIELTGAYATLANQGLSYPPHTIISIEDKHNKTIYVFHEEPKHVIDAGSAFLISSILSDNNARAEVFGNALTISRTAAVKTGTTEDYRDALTLGYTPSLAIGVWVGNNDNHPMDQIAGSLGAAPIWRQLMEHYLAGTSREQFVQPTNIMSAPICRQNGLLAKTATSSAYLEYFLIGTQPSRLCAGGYTTTTSKEQQLTPTITTTQPVFSPTPSMQVAPSPTSSQPSPTEATSIDIEFRQKNKKD